MGAVLRFICPRRFQAFCLFADANRQHQTIGEIRRAWKASRSARAGGDEWNEGRCDALDNVGRRFFSSAAYKRGFQHGRSERRQLEQLRASYPGAAVPPDLRDL